jgi:chromosome segregation ATPase
MEKKIAFLAVLFLASNGLCQTPAKESDTLQSLLVEVHQLRVDIEAMTVASQRAQIALYGLQMQDLAVARATQRVDAVRNKCKGLEDLKQHLGAEVRSLETILAAATTTTVEAKATESRLAQIKSELEAQTTEAQTCQATEAEASSLLRTEQAKLTDLQDRIERIDKSLEKLSTVGR